MPTLDERVAYIEGRLEEQSQRFDARIDLLDAKVSRHFTWLVGIQVAVLIAIVGALLRSSPAPRL